MISDPSRVGGLQYIDNTSILGTVERLSLGGRPVWLVLSLLVIAAVGFAIYRLRSKLDNIAILGLAAVPMLLISPVTWSHHWTWLPITAYAALSVALLSANTVRNVLLALTAGIVIVLGISPKDIAELFGIYPDGELPAWFTIITCATAVLGVALSLTVAWAAAT